MNLATTYMGIELRNPLVASASPLSQTVDGIRRLEEAGVGAVVLYSLFEEELRREAQRFTELGTAGTESFAEALTYMPETGAGAGPSAHAAVEPLEDPIPLFRRDPGALVPHADRRHAVAVGELHPDAAALPRVLDRVVEEVENHPVDQFLVPARQPLRRGRDFDPDVPGFGARAHRARGARDRLVEVEPGSPDRIVAGVAPRHQKQVFHDLGELP